MRSRLPPSGILHRRDEERRRLARRRGREVAAHRHALRVTRCGKIAARVGRRVIPAAEEAHRHARPGRRVDLAALHRIEQRLARVLLRPHRRVAGSGLLPAHDHALGRLARRDVSSAPGWVRSAAILPQKLLSSAVRQRGMRIGAADQSDLVGIGARARLRPSGRSSAPSARIRTRASPASWPRSCRGCLCPSVSKLANSSFGDRYGCVSPSPFICVTS